MPTYAIICFGIAFLVALVAIAYQRADIRADYGSTMGGEMTTGGFWGIASLCCAGGSLAFVPWFVSPLVFVVVYGSSFVIRKIVERTTNHD